MSRTPGYKKALEEIESIVEEIENENVDVDILTGKVKRATYLINMCRKKLRATDDEVRKILEEFDGEAENTEGPE
ncbi:MAG TPA: exodeoxyribonuclease VII small subunit [Nitrospirae bacterium]|nr:exodeoxyribonuclease 7 small subunit [bacterium BMS3Abin10]GBE39345.1 exodeoxyribonuclease 7 small subunit [bacterium BMS3Bbin08]HDH51332.1 exodeoxyribonuclease VII small subunit [Nitrospirota bacterium]HDK17703.1 exodeoxyribonuclease VII small subunit [Nitrospirota bacterium]HDK81383.1 exodeoxyribonuclease VII small subunit [Nitrospirota bacterium]